MKTNKSITSIQMKITPQKIKHVKCLLIFIKAILRL